MATPLRVLILDDPAEAELMVAELRRAGHAVGRVRVDSEAELSDLLEPPPDLVLFDPSLPLGRAVMVALKPRPSAHDTLSAEVALLESEELLRRLTDSIPSMVFINQEGRVKYANTACEATGYSVEELCSPDFDFRRLIAPESLGVTVRAYEDHLEGRDVSPYEYQILRRDGARIHAINAPRLIRYQGKPAILGVVTDITERVRGEQALKTSEALYRSLFEDSRDAVCIASLEGCLLDANESWVRLFGYTKSEALHLCLPDLCVAAADDLSVQHRMRVGETIRDTEVRLRTKAGIEMDCLLTATPWRAGDGEISGHQVIVRDITEEKRVQWRLQLSQRLEAVGQLAGGVAHDFNNILMAIMSSAELLRSDLDPDHRGHAEVGEIKQAANRAANLTRQLLAFSRRQVLEPRVLDLGAVVRDTEKMLRRLIGENIELVISSQDDLSSVRADPGQIEQVIMNLAVNARDAMPGGGRLIIEAADVELDEEYARKHVAAEPGSYVMIAVSDTGHGMDEETQARIFEPFFSTKRMGEGTGLGLATVYGIVKQSGGYIWVYSEPGHGTTFKVYLPAVPDAAGLQAETVPKAPTPHGVETVLVVEDEPAVRTLTSKFLRRFGYTILEASRPSEALTISQEHGPIHLLLTDVVMPEMSGPDLANRLAVRQEGLRILYVSGYADRAIITQEILGPNSAFMQKPFAPDALARKVREVLDAPAGGKYSPGSRTESPDQRGEPS